MHLRSPANDRKEQRDSHLTTRLAFSQCFADVLCFLLGPETNGNVEFGGEGELVTVAESREPMSSGAIDALTVVALDLAAMLWSVMGRGHHPRLLIHDSPKVADMAPALYSPLFNLAVKAERDAKIRQHFSTFSPPLNHLRCIYRKQSESY